jgi:hypothetical protein
MLGLRAEDIWYFEAERYNEFLHYPLRLGGCGEAAPVAIFLNLGDKAYGLLSSFLFGRRYLRSVCQ